MLLVGKAGVWVGSNVCVALVHKRAVAHSIEGSNHRSMQSSLMMSFNPCLKDQPKDKFRAMYRCCTGQDVPRAIADIYCHSPSSVTTLHSEC